MIDTDKYEGDTSEVKRLRDAIERAIAYKVGDDAIQIKCKALGKQLNPTKGKKHISNKLPKHPLLGELTFLEEDNEGNKLYYRECLTLWSKEEQKAYEVANKCCSPFYGFIHSMGDFANRTNTPIFGISAWQYADEME
tara:strand:- start:388 stop:801 length:414 start_codon:yes stop_codon:yes gene_type:complete